MYAFLDKNGNVVAMGRIKREVSEVRKKNPLVVSVIESAPKDLQIKRPGCEHYHRHVHSDGSSIGHYSLLREKNIKVKLIKPRKDPILLDQPVNLKRIKDILDELVLIKTHIRRRARINNIILLLAALSIVETAYRLFLL